MLFPLELENRASPAARRLEPDATTLPLNDTAHDGQAHAATLNLIARLQRLKHLEHAFRVLRRYALAVVRDGKHVVVALLHARDDDAALRPRVVLDRIADQVAQHLLERRR